MDKDTQTIRQILFRFALLGGLMSSTAQATVACPGKDRFDEIIQTVTDNFFDRTFRGLDWPQRTAFYRKKIDCAVAASNVAAVINGLLRELQTSHTALYTTDDIEYWGLKSIFSGDLDKFKVWFAGIWPIEINGEIYAKLVLQGSPADKVGVRVGDKLISLDGKAFEPLGFLPRGSILRISSDGTHMRDLHVRPEFKSIQDHFLTATKRSQKVFRAGNKRIGYFHLWCGTHDSFLGAMNKSLLDFKKKNVDGLIIDLRDGFGGAYPDYLKMLVNDDTLKNVPKAFLINGGVKSGKEWVSALVKRDHVGRLVGTKTAGAFMAGKPFEFSDAHYLLYLAVKEFQPPHIPKLEGVGVDPDEKIIDCVQYCNGKDPVIEQALQVGTNWLDHSK